MRDIKKLIDKIKKAKSIKASDSKSVFFVGRKQGEAVPKDFTNELYLMCL